MHRSRIWQDKILNNSKPPKNVIHQNHSYALDTIPKDLPDKIKDIQQCCLIIHGALDPLVPIEHAQFLLDRIENSRIVIIDFAGHMLFSKGAWIRLVEVITEFIRGSNVNSYSYLVNRTLY